MVTLNMNFSINPIENKAKHVASRGILFREGCVLLVYKSKSDMYMIPGGGVEDGESSVQCCVREMAEETGVVVSAKNPMLIIKEQYDKADFTNYYYDVEYVRETDVHLTKKEVEAGMTIMWLPLNEAISIFSKHDEYKDSDIIKCGLYRREYAALSYFNAINKLNYR